MLIVSRVDVEVTPKTSAPTPGNCRTWVRCNVLSELFTQKQGGIAI